MTVQTKSQAQATGEQNSLEAKVCETAQLPG
jgi:hypothetical protein